MSLNYLTYNTVGGVKSLHERMEFTNRLKTLETLGTNNLAPFFNVLLNTNFVKQENVFLVDRSSTLGLVSHFVNKEVDARVFSDHLQRGSHVLDELGQATLGLLFLRALSGELRFH